MQKGAWPQKPVKPAKAARACFRRFFAAPTPSAALANHPGKFPKTQHEPTNCASSPKRESQPASCASSLRSNASPPSWNASPNPSPIKQPESQVFKPPESRTRLQPACSLTLSVLHRKFTGNHWPEIVQIRARQVHRDLSLIDHPRLTTKLIFVPI